jgi:hypothetical protein
MKTKQVTVSFKGQSLALPAGLRVKPVAPYPTQVRKQYWLDEFPADLFPPNSIIRHDAVHYGVWLEESEVQS